MKSFLNFKKIASLILLLPSIFILGSFQKPFLENLQTNNYLSNEIQQYNLENDKYYIEQISTGVSHSAAVVSEKNNPYNDSLYMWGNNTYGQLGLGDEFQNNSYTTPQKITLLPEGNIEEVAMGSYSTFISITDEAGNNYGYSWGKNNKGQLGNGEYGFGKMSNTPQCIFSSKNITKQSSSQIKQISAGANFAGAVIMDKYDNDSLYTWGDNSYGQLGLEKKSSKKNKNLVPEPTLVIFENSTGAVKINIEFGSFHSMALIDNGANQSLYTWGNNHAGELGLGHKDNCTNPDISYYGAPQKVTFFDSIINENKTNIAFEPNKMSAGYSTSSIVLHDKSSNYDSLYSWGFNIDGQLGTGNNTDQCRPTEVELFPPNSNDILIDQISFSYLYSAAIVDNGVDNNALYTWGINDYGQLGYDIIDDNNNINHPKKVTNLPDAHINQVSTGKSYTTVLVSNDPEDYKNQQTLYTWGSNEDGQFGNGQTSDQGESNPQLIALMPILPTFSEASISEVKENTATLNFDYENGNNYLNEEYQLCSLKVEDANNPNLYSKTFDSNDILTNPDNNSSVNLTTLEPDTDYKLKLEGDFEIPSQSSNSQTAEYEPLIEFSTVKEEPEFTETPVVIETIDDTATIIIEYSSGFDSEGDPYELTELTAIDVKNSKKEYETNFDELVINSDDNQIEIIISGLEPGKHLLKFEGTFESTLDYDAKIIKYSSSFKVSNGDNFFVNYWYYFLTLILIIIISIIILIWLKNRSIKLN